MFGVVQKTHEYIIHIKGNCILDLLVVTLLVTQRNPKRYRFYRLNHISRIIDICNAKLIENIEVSGIVDKRIVDINKTRVDVPTSTIVPNIIPILEEKNNNE